MEGYPPKYIYRRIVQVRRYMDAHDAGDIDLDQIANEACFSKFHFIRFFKRMDYQTPGQHLAGVRLGQDSAFNFYVNKPGFKVHTDARMRPGMRWLTVTPPEQPEQEIALMPVARGMMFNKKAAEKMRSLVSTGTFGFGVFECSDIYAACEALMAKGLVFKKEPTKEFYGIEALFKDDSGNSFSPVQKR